MQTRARFVICLVIYRPASAYNPSKSAIYIIHSPRGVTHNGAKDSKYICISVIRQYCCVLLANTRIVVTRSTIEKFENRIVMQRCIERKKEVLSVIINLQFCEYSKRRVLWNKKSSNRFISLSNKISDHLRRDD